MTCALTRRCGYRCYVLGRCEQGNKFLKRELEQSKDRVTSLKQECDLRADESVKHLQAVDDLKRKISRLQQERDAAARDKTKEARS